MNLQETMKNSRKMNNNQTKYGVKFMTLFVLDLIPN